MSDCSCNGAAIENHGCVGNCMGCCSNDCSGSCYSLDYNSNQKIIQNDLFTLIHFIAKHI